MSGTLQQFTASPNSWRGVQMRDGNGPRMHGGGMGRRMPPPHMMPPFHHPMAYPFMTPFFGMPPRGRFFPPGGPPPYWMCHPDEEGNVSHPPHNMEHPDVVRPSASLYRLFEQNKCTQQLHGLQCQDPTAVLSLTAALIADKTNNLHKDNLAQAISPVGSPQAPQLKKERLQDMNDTKDRILAMLQDKTPGARCLEDIQRQVNMLALTNETLPDVKRKKAKRGKGKRSDEEIEESQAGTPSSKAAASKKSRRKRAPKSSERENSSVPTVLNGLQLLELTKQMQQRQVVNKDTDNKVPKKKKGPKNGTGRRDVFVRSKGKSESQSDNKPRIKQTKARLIIEEPTHSLGPGGDSVSSAIVHAKDSVVQSVYPADKSGGGSVVLRREIGGHLDVRVQYSREFLLQCSSSPFTKLPPAAMPYMAQNMNEIIPPIPQMFDCKQHKKDATDLIANHGVTQLRQTTIN